MTLKIVMSSDWHGDVVTQGVVRYGEVETSAMRTVQHAIDIKADAYFFGGDLCDPHTARAHRVVALAHRGSRQLQAAGIPDYWLVGNHDVVEDGSGSNTLMSLRGVEAEPRHFTFASRSGVGALNVVMLPFTPTSHAYDPVEFIDGLEIPNTHPILVLGHLNLHGITAGSETKDMPRGREVYWPVDELKRKWPNATLVGGHYHERQEYQGVRLIGSMARLTYGEGHNEVGYLELEI